MTLLHGALEGVIHVRLWTCDSGAIGVVPSLEAPHLRLVLVTTSVLGPRWQGGAQDTSALEVLNWHAWCTGDLSDG
jgi:hypothetical protein